MLATTISEYLEIWPRAFPYMVVIGFIFTVFLILFSSIHVFITWFTPNRRFQKSLAQGSAIFLHNLKGWLIYACPFNFYIVWGSLLLIPIVSFIPIVFFDVRTLIFYWFIICSGILLFLYYLIFAKFHAKLAPPKYYISNSCFGLRFFLQDIIIPSSAINELMEDRQKLRTAIKFQYKVRIINWKRTMTIYFRFSTLKDLNGFTEKINAVSLLKWQEKALSPLGGIITTAAHESIQFIDGASLEEQLPSRILQILS